LQLLNDRLESELALGERKQKSSLRSTQISNHWIQVRTCS
jgi:hypothetical protein